MTKKTRYEKVVDKVYEELTNQQLSEQVAKFWYSDIEHEKGKLGRALEEINRRRHE